MLDYETKMSVILYKAENNIASNDDMTDCIEFFLKHVETYDKSFSTFSQFELFDYYLCSFVRNVAAIKSQKKFNCRVSEKYILDVLTPYINCYFIAYLVKKLDCSELRIFYRVFKSYSREYKDYSTLFRLLSAEEILSVAHYFNLPFVLNSCLAEQNSIFLGINDAKPKNFYDLIYYYYEDYFLESLLEYVNNNKILLMKKKPFHRLLSNLNVNVEYNERESVKEKVVVKKTCILNFLDTIFALIENRSNIRSKNNKAEMENNIGVVFRILKDFVVLDDDTSKKINILCENINLVSYNFFKEDMESFLSKFGGIDNYVNFYHNINEKVNYELVDTKILSSDLTDNDFLFLMSINAPLFEIIDFLNEVSERNHDDLNQISENDKASVLINFCN